MKDQILTKVILPSGELNPNLRKLLTKEELTYLQNSTGDTLAEKLHLLTHSRPLCSCGEETKFKSYIGGYRSFCSPKCANSNVEKVEKTRKVFETKYGQGIINAQQIKEVSKQTALTKIAKYGSPFFNPIATKQTKLQRYGDSGFVNPAKGARTKQDRYRSATFNNREKAQKTCIERYGCTQGFMKVRYKYQGLIFDSSWELAYFIKLTADKRDFQYKPEALSYAISGDPHLYYPDFLVEGEYVEIKADTSFDSITRKLKLHPRQKITEAALHSLAAKQKCLDDNRVRVLTKKDVELRAAFTYITKTFGAAYLKQFKEGDLDATNTINKKN
jgi:hypothetical protein